jgi:hypothetical protein
MRTEREALAPTLGPFRPYRSMEMPGCLFKIPMAVRRKAMTVGQATPVIVVRPSGRQKPEVHDPRIERPATDSTSSIPVERHQPAPGTEPAPHPSRRPHSRGSWGTLHCLTHRGQLSSVQLVESTDMCRGSTRDRRGHSHLTDRDRWGNDHPSAPNLRFRGPQ